MLVLKARDHLYSECEDCKSPICYGCSAMLLNVLGNETCVACRKRQLFERVREDRQTIAELEQSIDEDEATIASAIALSASGRLGAIGVRTRAAVVSALRGDGVLCGVDVAMNLAECVAHVYVNSLDEEDYAVARLADRMKEVIEHAEPWGKETQKTRAKITRSLNLMHDRASTFLPDEMRVLHQTWKRWSTQRRFPQSE